MGRGPVTADVKIPSGKDAFSTLGPTKGSARTCLGGGGADREQLIWRSMTSSQEVRRLVAVPVRELTQVAAAACLVLPGLRVAPGAEKTVAGKQVVLVGRLALRFCNRHPYQAPISSQSAGGGSKGGGGKVCYSTCRAKGGNRGRCGRFFFPSLSSSSSVHS